MISSREVLIMVLNCTLDVKTDKRVRVLVNANKCLCGCGGEAVKRGLAQKCYDKYRWARLSLPAKQRRQFDFDLIQRGELLDAYGRRQYLSTDNKYIAAARKTREAS